MDNHVRTSDVSRMMELRKSLWEAIYTNSENMQLFTHYLYNNFILNTIECGAFDFTNNTLKIKSNGRPFEYNDINPRIGNAYVCFLKDMLAKNKINKEDYDMCIDNLNMLYFITFIDNNNICINL